MLSREEAEKELSIAAKLNPGPWVEHSKSVGLNAGLIAGKIAGLDSDTAYVMGLLHDIGRREGAKGIMHLFDGYDYMNGIQQEEIARICLTHSYPVQNAYTYVGKYDCSDEQRIFLADYIKNIIYDDYDKLIQLCDAMSLPNGACIMEKRLIDVALRHGLPDFTIDKWKAYIVIKKYFDALCNCNIYTFLPNVMANSYEDLM